SCHSGSTTPKRVSLMAFLSTCSRLRYARWSTWQPTAGIRSRRPNEMLHAFDVTRRTFVEAFMLGAAGLAARGQSGAQIPKRPLGRTGLEVSALGIGGYHLGSANSDAEATQIVNEALDAGVNFFDNAWEYHQGLSEERLGRALKGKRDRAVVMTKVCTHGRDKIVAMRQLEESLTRLQTDHLDVWQIHEVIYENNPDLIFAPNGAAEALLEARQQGKVRFLGFTRHKDPSIHLKILSSNLPVH